MPISPIVLQRRHAELGRIRLGNQVATSNGKTRPNKLDKFRFTSASEGFINDLAALYGGTPRQWDNNGKPEWEVFTDAQTVPVIVVKGGLSQWLETWSGGGCTHRCDGETNHLTGDPCDPNDPAHVNAKPTTRLSLMLPELEAIGVWRCETHGWNAAAEIPAVAELAQFVGDLVPARLHLMERRTVKDGQTSRFVVPVLDLQIGSQRLKEIVAEKSGQALPAADRSAIGGGERAALPAGSAARTPDYLAQAQDASAPETVFAIWHAANKAGHMTDELNAQLQAVASSLKNAAAQVAAPNPDGSFDAEVVDDGQADALWQQCLTEGGKKGLLLEDVTNEYSRFTGGQLAATATGAQLEAFLGYLRNGAEEQVPA